MDMSATTDIGQLSSEAKCFRLRRYYLHVGIIGAAFFGAMAIGCTAAALWNIDGSFARPKLAALINGTFWSGFTLLAIWIIATYFRERLYIAKAAIVQYGIFRTRTLPFAEVLRIKWRTWPKGGSVVVRTHFEKATIHLENFTTNEREELIRFLHETLDVEIQESWPQFEEFLNRSSEPSIVVSRGRIMALAALLICFACVFAYCWLAGLGGKYLLLSIFNIVVATWYLWRMRWSKLAGHAPCA
jgi:hypothetical protein